MGHQARAAPALMLRARLRGLESSPLRRRARTRLEPEAVLERALDAGVERVEPVQRERLDRAEPPARRRRPSSRPPARADTICSPITRCPSSRPSSVSPISAP